MSTTSLALQREEHQFLRDMIGKPFIQFKCDPFVYSPTVYGIVALFIGEKAYRISSLFQSVTRFFAVDDVSAIQITETNGDDIRSLMDGGEFISTPVDGVIRSIDIITDHQIVTHDHRDYSFDATVGIIFRMEDDREISFEIGTWFSEMITVRRGYHLIDQFVPTSEFLSEWEDSDGYEAHCTRDVTTIS